MSVTTKHLATFLLGAAAGVALHKYSKTEEGQELVEKLKSKGEELKNEAEETINQAPEYFEMLKTQASGSLNEVLAKLKETFPDAENILTDLFSKKTTETIEVKETKDTPTS